MSESSGLSRRTVLAGASATAIIALMEWGTPVQWAYAAVPGYNLPYTNLAESGTVVPGYVSNDPYGRYGPYGERSIPHSGSDFNGTGRGTVNGRKVFPIRSGTVSFSGDKGDTYGQHVIVNHDDGRRSLYAHFQSRAVTNGDAVSPSTILGLIGSTGNSSGPHLHVTVYKPNSSATEDPWLLLDGAPFANGVATAPPVIPAPEEEIMKLYRIVNPQGGLNGTTVLMYNGGFAVYESASWRDRLGARYNLALQDISQDDFADECNRFTIPFNKVAEKAVAGGGSWSWSQQISAQIAAL